MKVLLSLLLLLMPAIGWCQWNVKVEWDQLTDRRSAGAYTPNAEGDTLHFWFPDDGSARITIKLHRSTFDLDPTQFSKEQLPIYRVDREPPVDLNSLKEKLQIRTSDEGGAIGWNVADKRLGQPPTLVAGKRLLVRYIDGEGEQHDLVFLLDGADRAYKLAAELQE